ncbi:MAG: hypothetical protein ABI414_09995 [Devosia sp.]
MRALLGLAIGLMLAGPSAAKDPSVFEQYEDIRGIFLPDTQSVTEYIEGQAGRLMDGLDGTWFRMGAFLPTQIDAETFERGCANVGQEIRVRDAYAFDVITDAGEDIELTTTYSAKGGNTFGSHVDPTALLHWLYLDTERAKPSQIYEGLANNNGVAAVFRPSADVLVIQTDYGIPQIYGRCP